MGLSTRVRAECAALTPEQRQRVVKILGPDLATGWIPKAADIAAAIAIATGTTSIEQRPSSAAVPARRAS